MIPCKCAGRTRVAEAIAPEETKANARTATTPGAGIGALERDHSASSALHTPMGRAPSTTAIFGAGGAYADEAAKLRHLSLFGVVNWEEPGDEIFFGELQDRE